MDRIGARLIDLHNSLQSLRSVISPIRNLPPELLAHIFSFFPDPTPSSFLPERQLSSHPYYWLPITQVCQYWRDVALRHPSLWTIIDSSDTSMAQVGLTRSGGAQVQVYLHDKVYSSHISASLEGVEFLETLASHSTRFREFHIQPQFRYGPTILSHFRHPAPNLKALTICLQLAMGETPLVLPKLFSGNTPKLERLTLCNFSSWPDNCFKDLTHICLYEQTRFGRVPLEEFLDFLSFSSRLEELILVDAGPTCSHSTDSIVGKHDARRLLPLRNLRLLEIGDWPTARNIADFLYHLIIPSEAKLYLWGERLMRDFEDISTLMPPDLACIYNLHDLTTINVTAIPPMAYGPQLFTAYDATLQLDGEFRLPSILPSVFRTLDVHRIKELSLWHGCKIEMTVEEWSEILHKMPELVTLRTVRRLSCHMLTSLQLHDTPLSEVLISPALANLEIVDDPSLSGSLLSDTAELRAKFGYALKRVCIVNQANRWSQTEEDLVKEVGRFVDEVTYTTELRRIQMPEDWPSRAYQWTRSKQTSRHRLRG